MTETLTEKQRVAMDALEAELVPLHGIAPSGARPNAEEIRKSAGNSVQIRCSD